MLFSICVDKVWTGSIVETWKTNKTKIFRCCHVSLLAAEVNIIELGDITSLICYLLDQHGPVFPMEKAEAGYCLATSCQLIMKKMYSILMNNI